MSLGGVKAVIGRSFWAGLTAPLDRDHTDLALSQSRFPFPPFPWPFSTATLRNNQTEVLSPAPTMFLLLGLDSRFPVQLLKFLCSGWEANI